MGPGPREGMLRAIEQEGALGKVLMNLLASDLRPEALQLDWGLKNLSLGQLPLSKSRALRILSAAQILSPQHQG